MQDVAIPHPGLPARGLRRLSAAAMFLLLLLLPLSSTVAVPLVLPLIGGLGTVHSNLSVTPILTVAVVALGILQYWRDSGSRPLSMGPAALAIPMVGLVVLGLITAPFSIDPGQSLSSSLCHVQLLALYLVAVNCAVDRRAIAAGLALGAVLQAVVGWPQFLLGHSLGLGTLGEYTVDAASPGVSVVMMGQMRLLRAYGLTEHPNQLGGYLVFSIPVILGGLLYSTQGRHFRSLLSTAAVIALSALLVTFSRASWLGLAGRSGCGVDARLLPLVHAPRRGHALVDSGSVGSRVERDVHCAKSISFANPVVPGTERSDQVLSPGGRGVLTRHGLSSSYPCEPFHSGKAPRRLRPCWSANPGSRPP